MFFRAPMKALLLTTSRVETPNTLLGSRVPALEKISQAMGTVELTGLEMMAIMALGQTLAAAVQMSATMLALVLNRSSLVMPGLRGTPAKRELGLFKDENLNCLMAARKQVEKSGVEKVMLFLEPVLLCLFL